jgi:hypothetical protein
MPGADGEGQGATKPNSEFAKERQQSKKQQMQEVERARDEAIAESTRLRIEHEQAQSKITKLTEETEQLRTLATTREKDLETFDDRYFASFGAENFRPEDDQELRAAHETMMGTLRDNMPAYVTTQKDGQKRVMFEQLASNPAIAVGLENCLLHYAAAQRSGNADTMDLAVNSVCQLLGADVEIFAPNDQRNRTITPDDPLFRDVERAMKFAVPSLQKKADRARYVQENAPKLAEQRFETRTSAIRAQVKGAIDLPRDQIAARLQKDPTDTVAVFASIMQAVPHLKETVEAQIVRLAEDAAAIPDQLIPRPLKAKDKVAIAEHRKMQDTTRQRLSEDLVYAMIGRASGPIFTSLIAARDEALERAGAASLNTNPGGGGGGEGTRPITTTPRPNTSIMPDSK